MLKVTFSMIHSADFVRYWVYRAKDFVILGVVLQRFKGQHFTSITDTLMFFLLIYRGECFNYHFLSVSLSLIRSSQKGTVSIFVRKN